MKNTGRFDWYELMTKDINKAKAFYTELFNWKTEAHPVKKSDGSNYEYTIFKANGKPVAGLSLPDHAALNNTWLAYTTVQNLDQAVNTLQKNGGKILVAEEKIPDIGRWVIAIDEQGAVFSPFEPTHTATETNEMNVGTFCWHELATSDVEKATVFYTEMFGWEKGERSQCTTTGSVYQLLKRRNQGVGGIYAAKAGNKPSWKHYVTVENVDETAKRCKSLGGSVTMEPENLPEGFGRIACLNDNQGAEIAVWAKK